MSDENPYAFRRSVSQRRLYRECNYKWLQHYVQLWEPKLRRGSYDFGNVMERVATDVAKRTITTETDAETRFREDWNALKQFREQRFWGSKQSWEVFEARGRTLAKVLVRELPLRIKSVKLVQHEVSYLVQPGTEPELGYVDIYGSVLEGEPGGSSPLYVPTILDFKTGQQQYNELAAELDEQLTSYQLGLQAQKHPVMQLGLCVMLWQAAPRVQWVMAPARDEEAIARFRASAVLVDEDIKAGRFGQNPKACFNYGECEYVPLCFPSQRHRIEAELQRSDGKDKDKKKKKPKSVKPFSGDWDDD